MRGCADVAHLAPLVLDCPTSECGQSLQKLCGYVLGTFLPKEMGTGRWGEPLTEERKECKSMFCYGDLTTLTCSISSTDAAQDSECSYDLYERLQSNGRIGDVPKKNYIRDADGLPRRKNRAQRRRRLREK